MTESAPGPVGASATASVTITIANPDTWDGADPTAISYAFAKSAGVNLNLADSWKAEAALRIALAQVQDALSRLYVWR